eukprot:Awhi_evm1s2170
MSGRVVTAEDLVDDVVNNIVNVTYPLVANKTFINETEAISETFVVFGQILAYMSTPEIAMHRYTLDAEDMQILKDCLKQHYLVPLWTKDFNNSGDVEITDFNMKESVLQFTSNYLLNPYEGN